MKKAIVTGAAGFTGITLVKMLVDYGYYVYAIVRPDSQNNFQLHNISNISIIEIDMLKDYNLSDYIHDKCEVAFHLACVGGRYDFDIQYFNIDMTLSFIRELKRIRCNKIICTGSQAEYGLCNEIITEKTKLKPFCAYGTVKVATSYLSKYLSLDSGIEWIWARIFSLYGENEPKGRMLPDLVYKLKNGESVMLSSCRQNWDYLNVYDGAKALIALAQHGRSGEIYNVAHGEYNNLKYFVNIVEEELNCCNKVIYGEDANPFVSLQPDVSKIKRDTGWLPEIDFRKGIHQLFN